MMSCLSMIDMSPGTARKMLFFSFCDLYPKTTNFSSDTSSIIQTFFSRIVRQIGLIVIENVLRWNTKFSLWVVKIDSWLTSARALLVLVATLCPNSVLCRFKTLISHSIPGKLFGNLVMAFPCLSKYDLANILKSSLSAESLNQHK